MTGADLHSAIVRQNISDLDRALETKYVYSLCSDEVRNRKKWRDEREREGGGREEVEPYKF